MKSYLSFNLNTEEDRYSFSNAAQADKLANIINQFKSFLRSGYKYGTFDSNTRPRRELSEEEEGLFDDLHSELLNIIEENGVVLSD